MSRRNRAHSQTTHGNSKAQLIAAYNELGKELSDTRMRVVGNYNIGRVIGEGSYGKVRLGTHRLTGTRVALKQIPKSVSAQLTREIHHHRQLHHSNIVQLYEVIATETSIWLVTELCAGGELFDYLVEKGRIDEYEARLFFGQLCLAVAYCHDQGVVHRDLKLENVLLDDRTQIKLSDFGFTREFERGALLETFCGTTGYASPEMLQGQKYLGQEVDIWSLGIILYTLLVGALPFDDDDEEETKRKILAGTYDIPEWMSSEARDLIEGILVQEPTKRLSLQQILSSSWFLKRMPTISPALPPSLLPSATADSSDAIRQSSDMLQIDITTSPTTRSSTPPNRTDGSSTLLDDMPRDKSLDGDRSASPSRTTIDRRNSSQSIIPPLPTRTPVRTKRRSVSSAISPSNSPKHRPSSALFSATEQPDFIGAMSQQTAVVFSTPQERAMLSSLAALGFDTGQIVHSVLNDACDSAGALWWILRKKVGDIYALPEEPNSIGLAVADPFIDSKLDEKRLDGTTAVEGVEQNQGLARNGVRPTVLLEEVDASRKKKRTMEASASLVESQAKKTVREIISSPVDVAIVPPTPVAAEEVSKHQGTASPTRNLSPARASTSVLISNDTHVHTPSSSTPPGSKIYSNKARSGSISMLQRATTVLGGAAGLVRKKSEEGGLTNASSSGSTKERDRSNEEPRTSSGSGGRLTKSPPPGKISKEAKERQNSVDSSTFIRAASTGDQPSTYPVHGKSKPSQLRRALTEGGGSSSSAVARDNNKPRNRVSILNTFRGLWDEGWRKKQKAGPIGTPSNSPAGVLVISPQGSSKGGYLGPERPVINPERPYTPRKHGSIKGTTSRRGGRSHKDKRPSVSSRRSSSINSRRSSITSMASLVKQSGTLGSVGEYTVYTGAPLTRKVSDNSRQSIGTRTPMEEDSFEPSRPGSAVSYSQNASLAAGIGKRGKRHSKSSSTSSGGSLSRHVGTSNRPPSRSGTTSPLPVGHAHRRVGSGSSQTRVVKQYVKKSSAIGKSLEAATEAPPPEVKETKRLRSGSMSSAQSGESYVLDEDGEFGGRRTTSPLGRTVRSVMVAQKKTSTYGSPSNSLGLSGGRSSWKKSWGQEPPGWAYRSNRQEVIVEILDSRHSKGAVRDVFANGGKSGAPHGTIPDDEDDWSDIDDDTGYAGGLGQLSSAHNLPATTANPNSAPIDSPPMVFLNSKAGRRSNRNPLSMSQISKSSGMPTQAASNSPNSPPTQGSSSSVTGMDGLGSERNPGRRQLPGARSNFRGAAIVEEEEEEEEE